MDQRALNFLCISSYFKGNSFMEGIKDQGHKVYLLTSQKLDKEPWAWHAIDQTFYLPTNEEEDWNYQDMLSGLAWLMKSIPIDRIVALDDFDVEKAAFLREEFRIPGMGQSTARYFRDKLAMRIQARDENLSVPSFSALFNDAQINEYLSSTQGPWLIKPRAEASATGITKVHSPEEAWSVIHALGEKRSRCLIESFRPGKVYHVDGLSYNGKVIFARASQYLDTPFEVAHQGGIFRTQTLSPNSSEEKQLLRFNEKVMKAFGMEYSAFHSEFIQDIQGDWYFLETSSRVGGANIADMVEAATGIDLWREWGKIEIAKALKIPYTLPPLLKNNSGIVLSLSRQKNPDTTPFFDKEILTFIQKDYHIGMVLTSPSADRIRTLLNQYMEVIYKDYHASAPVPDKPTS
jgi:hypothetical protein